MQLVPSSGGREAYRKAKGKDVAPSRDYLFDPANNVELGTAYLNVLMFNQLEAVAHNVSREYCVIAAYNTGPSNVFRTFSRDRTAAVNQINGLQPAGVYDQLRQNLPYQETRQLFGKSDRLSQSLRQCDRPIQLSHRFTDSSLGIRSPLGPPKPHGISVRKLKRFSLELRPLTFPTDLEYSATLVMNFPMPP